MELLQSEKVIVDKILTQDLIPYPDGFDAFLNEYNVLI